MNATTVEILNFFDELNTAGSSTINTDDIADAYARFQDEYQLEQRIPLEIMTGSCMRPNTKLDRMAFHTLIKSWHTPIVPLACEEPQVTTSHDYEKSLPLGRRIRAHQSVEGYRILFMTIVILIILGNGLSECIKNYKRKPVYEFLGWGLLLAKFSAGVLQPALAFLIISSSRTLATYLRTYSILCKVIDWDRSRTFHMRMAFTVMFFTLTHIIGHLAGTLVCISASKTGEAHTIMANFKVVRPTYFGVFNTVPAISGLVAFACLATIFICAMPSIRRLKFELFQFTHILLYPMMLALLVHGSSRWIQRPMLEYFIPIPFATITLERMMWCFRGFIDLRATKSIVDKDTICITVSHGKKFRYKAGQYVLVRVLEISRFQWHPFTISSVSEDEFTCHISTNAGDWTKKLRNAELNTINVNGPFGAPAQRFDEFEKCIFIAGGIGVTPYTGILSNLIDGSCKKGRIDFHWIARDAKAFGWAAPILNRAAEYSDDISIATYSTQLPRTIANRAFRDLVDTFRGPMQCESALTGLVNNTTFSRADFANIFRRFRKECLIEGWKGNIGVFFCGNKYMAMELSDRCSKSRSQAGGVIFEFIPETF